MKAPVGQQATSEITPHASAVGSRAEHRFYVGAALLMISLSIAGFGPSILEQSRRNAPSSPIVMTHGMVVGAGCCCFWFKRLWWRRDELLFTDDWDLWRLRLRSQLLFSESLYLSASRGAATI
jgi:hypothetical protein